jgi:hypothetical protein
MWGDPGAAKAPPNNRRAFAQRNPIGRLHAQTHHAANDALTNGKPGKVPARHVPMLAARAPGLQGETIVVVYDAGRGIFSSFVGLFFASEMFPIIFIFFLYLSFPSLQRDLFQTSKEKKKRALLLLCAKEDKEEEDKEEGRPPKGRLFLSLSHAKG